MESTTPRGTRTGFTTGACAAAAARAAAQGLETGQVPDAMESLLPNGQRVRFDVHDRRCDAHSAHAMVVKFAGDDPDCTDAAHLTVDLRLRPGKAGEIAFVAGDGVGTVTLPGLGLAVGGPAINPVPRQNIADNLREAAPRLLTQHGLEVTVSVPGGQEMAKKTTNARLGILGGISILGTTGIVKPYSTAAWRASVVQGIQVAATLDHGVVALTTGGRTETFAMQTLRAERPGLPAACFVQMGDFLRYALDEVVAQGLPEVVLGVMVGKLTKIAQGETITHANRNVVDTDLVAEIARQIGATDEDCAAIAAARPATTVFPEPTSPCNNRFIGDFFSKSCKICHAARRWSAVRSNGSCATNCRACSAENGIENPSSFVCCSLLSLLANRSPNSSS